MQKNQVPFSTGAVLLMVAAFVGAAVNVGYWAWAKRHADVLETPLFQAAASIRELERSCEREQARRSHGTELLDPQAAGQPEDPMVAEQNQSCSAVGPARAHRDDLLQEQERRRASAWRCVPLMALWPVLMLAGLVWYLRGQRR